MRPAVKGMSMAGVNESAVLSYTSQAVGPETGAAGAQFAAVLRLLSVPPIQIDCAAAGTDAVAASGKATATRTDLPVLRIRRVLLIIAAPVPGFPPGWYETHGRSAKKSGRPKTPPSVTPHYMGRPRRARHPVPMTPGAAHKFPPAIAHGKSRAWGTPLL